jgi:hypothetical protein
VIDATLIVIVVEVGCLKSTSMKLRPLITFTSRLPPAPGSASCALAPISVNVWVVAVLPVPGVVVVPCTRSTVLKPSAANATWSAPALKSAVPIE